MFASPSTELRGYENPYGLPHCVAMALQDDRREKFQAWMEASGLNMNKVALASGVSYNTIRSYVGDGTGKQTGSLSGLNEAKIANAYNLAVEDIFGTLPGDDQPPNHLRAWRLFRGLTVEQLAAAADVAVASIEYLEAAPSPPSGKMLRKLAPALNTMPGFLQDFDPNNVDTAALEAAVSLQPQQPKADPKAAERKSRKAAAA